MRLTRRSGTLLLAAVLSVGTGAPVEATSAKDLVRYADGSCPGKGFGVQHLCAPWRLRLRSGRVVRLTDARLFVDQGSKRPGLAPFALSPHGSQAAYFRLKDDALVIRDVTTGKVRVVPGVKWSLTNRFRIGLSPAAQFVVTRRGELHQVLNSVTAQAYTLPAGQYPMSFSPDNKHLLVRQRDGTSVVYSTETWSVVRTGPRAAFFPALHTNGTTIAYIDSDPFGKEPGSIRFLDLAGGPVSSPIKLPAGEDGNALLWDRANHLDILTRAHSGHDLVWRWRRANDGMRVLDTFVQPPSEFSVDDEIDVFSGVLDY